jgi:hypothetical protein
MLRLARWTTIGLLSLMVLAEWILPTPSVRAAQQPASSQNTFIVQPESDQPADEIRRGYFTLSVMPGETRSVRLAVKNTHSEALTVLNYPADSYQIADSGIDYTTREKTLAGFGTWMTVDPPRMTLAPGEAQRITATIQLPADLPAGEYVGGIAVENERVEAQGAGSNIMIDIHYRKLIAALVNVPSERSVRLEVGKIELTPADKGSRALVELRNEGNVLLKGNGSIEIGGGQASSGPVPFTVDTILPASQVQIPVELPLLTLQPGSYDVRLQVQSAEHGPLATWEGQVVLAIPQPTVAAAPKDLLLEPRQQPAAAAQDLSAPEATAPPPIWPIAAATAVVVLLLTLVVRPLRR